MLTIIINCLFSENEKKEILCMVEVRKKAIKPRLDTMLIIDLGYLILHLKK